MSSKKYRNQGMGLQAVNRQEGQYVYTNRSQIPAPPPCCQTPQAKVYLFYTVPNLYWITIEYWSGRRHVHLERLDIFQIAILLEGIVLELHTHTHICCCIRKRHFLEKNSLENRMKSTVEHIFSLVWSQPAWESWLFCSIHLTLSLAKVFLLRFKSFFICLTSRVLNPMKSWNHLLGLLFFLFLLQTTKDNCHCLPDIICHSRSANNSYGGALSNWRW